ncbi:MAG: polysaccharide deacetylase family protein [Ignavibacteriaceae bacterium]|nr:polysaccharide deacetylase family protein [Ignavibacteriaceae bacterium]
MIPYTTNRAIKLFHPGAIWDCDERGVMLTIDDGPSSGGTMKIIETLQEIGCKAIFFISGENIKGKEDILNEIIKHGHYLGNHGYLHKRISLLGKAELMKSIRSTNELIKSITGKDVTFYRPPYGAPSLFLQSVMKELQMQVVMWSLLAWDFRGSIVKSKTILTRYLKQGDIIVFHDNAKAASVFPEILYSLKSVINERGLEFLEPKCLK